MQCMLIPSTLQFYLITSVSLNDAPIQENHGIHPPLCCTTDMTGLQWEVGGLSLLVLLFPPWNIGY